MHVCKFLAIVLCVSHLQLASHLDDVVLRRVVLVAVGESEANICCKLTWIFVLPVFKAFLEERAQEWKRSEDVKEHVCMTAPNIDGLTMLMRGLSSVHVRSDQAQTHTNGRKCVKGFRCTTHIDVVC